MIASVRNWLLSWLIRLLAPKEGVFMTIHFTPEESYNLVELGHKLQTANVIETVAVGIYWLKVITTHLELGYSIYAEHPLSDHVIHLAGEDFDNDDDDSIVH